MYRTLHYYNNESGWIGSVHNASNEYVVYLRNYMYACLFFVLIMYSFQVPQLLVSLRFIYRKKEESFLQYTVVTKHFYVLYHLRNISFVRYMKH